MLTVDGMTELFTPGINVMQHANILILYQLGLFAVSTNIVINKMCRNTLQ